MLATLSSMFLCTELFWEITNVYLHFYISFLDINAVQDAEIHTDDDIMKWIHFPYNWPFVWGIHWSQWIPLIKGQ